MQVSRGNVLFTTAPKCKEKYPPHPLWQNGSGSVGCWTSQAAAKRDAQRREEWEDPHISSPYSIWASSDKPCQLYTLLIGPWKKLTQSAKPILFSAVGGFVVWILSGGYNTSIVRCTDLSVITNSREQEAKCILNIFFSFYTWFAGFEPLGNIYLFF